MCHAERRAQQTPSDAIITPTNTHSVPQTSPFSHSDCNTLPTNTIILHGQASHGFTVSYRWSDVNPIGVVEVTHHIVQHFNAKRHRLRYYLLLRHALTVAATTRVLGFGGRAEPMRRHPGGTNDTHAEKSIGPGRLVRALHLFRVACIGDTQFAFSGQSAAL